MFSCLGTLTSAARLPKPIQTRPTGLFGPGLIVNGLRFAELLRDETIEE
jgi:hypothetical protein